MELPHLADAHTGDSMGALRDPLARSLLPSHVIRVLAFLGRLRVPARAFSEPRNKAKSGILADKSPFAPDSISRSTYCFFMLFSILSQTMAMKTGEVVDCGLSLPSSLRSNKPHIESRQFKRPAY